MSQTEQLELSAARAAIEYCYAQGWDDGLPVVPPSEDHVREFTSFVGRDPAEVVCVAHHLRRGCTVQQAAINAVMAGCLPEYFPVVLAAIEALWGDPEKGFFGGMQSTTGAAPLILVNGPIRNDLGLNCGASVFGPGFRANATIGRTLRLITMNVFGVRPHGLDQGSQGNPGKYTLCIGENEEESPWEPLHVERGFDASSSTVTTCMALGTMQLHDRDSHDLEKLLLRIVDLMCARASFRFAHDLVVIGPEHAQLLAQGGWSKAQVRQFLWQHYGRTLEHLKHVGRGDFEDDGRSERAGSYLLVEVAREGHRMPGAAELTDESFINYAESPDDVVVIVAGARNAGVDSVVACTSFVGMRDNGRPVTFPIRDADSA